MDISFYEEKLPQYDLKSHLNVVQENLGYTFRETGYLLRALTHSSWAKENQVRQYNERLEFIGDAFLGLVIAEHLFRDSLKLTEGEMSRIRASLVQESTLAEIATAVAIDKALFLSRGEETSMGRQRESLLADALEAVIGAVYLDGGFAQAKSLVMHLYSDLLKGDLRSRQSLDAKTTLQEWVQENLKQTPTYRVTGASGPDHAKEFEVAVFVGEEQVAAGKGSSKKRASQAAAENAIEVVLNNNESHAGTENEDAI